MLPDRLLTSTPLRAGMTVEGVPLRAGQYRLGLLHGVPFDGVPEDQVDPSALDASSAEPDILP